jgi:predicted transcriptional regulator
LLSIKPEFALKIFNGSKRYEYRRAIFKNQEVSIVIVYASDPIRQVIGEFEIEDILHEELQSLWVKTKHLAGISEKRFFGYFANKSKGYATKVKTTTLYDDLLPLNSFKVSAPPQSFMYISQWDRQYELHRNLV